MKRRQQREFKLLMWILRLCLAGYIAGRPLYWQLNEAFSTAPSSCPPCHCDCSFQPLLSLLDGLSNNSIKDCMRQDSEVSEETEEKSFTGLLSEEVKQREAEAQEKQRLADITLLEAKKIASQYQKEADKCNSGWTHVRRQGKELKQHLKLKGKLLLCGSSGLGKEYGKMQQGSLALMFE